MTRYGGNYRIGKETFYLNKNIYGAVKNMNITAEEIKKEYNFLMRNAPFSGLITYNHAAHNLILRRQKNK